MYIVQYNTIHGRPTTLDNFSPQVSDTGRPLVYFFPIYLSSASASF